jgi:FtsP/CotA-like multicopper oxidase with cupredoxin domain
MTAAEHAAMTPAEGAVMDQAMMESVLAFPAETVGTGNEPLVPTILPDGTKHFELTAAVVDWEVTPGNTVQAWAYNGMVPGPRIDLEVGDEVEVQITNDLPLGTDIHWHGIDVPNGQDGVAPITQDLVETGETYTYRFTATDPAIGMYHAHAHGEQAVPNGLFGTMYVGEVPLPAGRTISGIEIPADLTVAQDVPMVLNDAGVVGLSLNGKGFPATAPLVVDDGDWITVTYFNEGMQVHPMHLHGFEQIVYAKDGEPLDQPYAADTILIGPGERYTVLFHADTVGTWVWHCHILNHVESEQGMFGMVTAVVVQP